MTRRFAGVFDPRGRADGSRLGFALASSAASIADRGPLRVTYSGPQLSGTDLLCLLDGYLDNEQDLRDALEPLSVPAEGAEGLLVAGWRRWGRALLPRLRGDFALLIWDQQQGEGLLARDQLGVRSLFLYEDGRALCFAGEIRDLLALLPCRPAPDTAGVAHWVAGAGRAGSGTLYAGVRRLEPGGVVLMGAHRASERRYWTPRFCEPAQIPQAEINRQVGDAIGLAVQRRLSSGGTTGVLMSGGLDSSAVAAVASVRTADSVAAYCGVFPEHPAVDESSLIAQLRTELRLSGVTAEVRAGGLLASALEFQDAWDAPLPGWGEFWTLPLLRHAASSGIDVMLDGDGGDELFAVRRYLIADQLRAGHPRKAFGLVGRLPGAAHGPPLGAMLKVSGRVGLLGALPYGVHSRLSRPFARRKLPGWLSARAARELLAADDPLAWKRLDGPRWWSSAAHVLTRGVEELGVFESLRRTAALAGLEARHPLFDLDLLELVLRQPPASSFDAHADRPVLRASMAGLLPDVVRLRRGKALFDPLIIDSLLGCDGAAVRALLADPQAELHAFVDLPAARSALLASGQEHPFLATQYLWRLVTAECWLRSQADPTGPALPAGLEVSAARVTLRTS